MSIRGPHNAQVQPPAPFVFVTIGNPLTDPAGLPFPAQLDTAADRTVVPLTVVQSLGLKPLDKTSVAGFGGKPHSVDRYVVSIAVQGFAPRPRLVIAHADEPWVLLGRDVLNDHRIVLDGPNLTLEVGP